MKLGPSFNLAYSPDGRRLAVIRARGVDVFTASAKWDRRRTRLAHPSHVAFSPDGSQLVTKTTAGHLFVWSTDDNVSAPRLLRASGGEGGAPSFTGCGRFLVDASWNGRVDLVSVDDGTTVWTDDFPGEMLTSVHATSDCGVWVFLHSPRATRPDAPPVPDYLSLRTHPFQGHSRRVLRPGLAFVCSSALSPDGTRIAMTHGAPPRTLSIVDTSTADIRRHVTIHPGGTGLALAWSGDCSRRGLEGL